MTLRVGLVVLGLVVLGLASGVLVGCGSQEPASTPSSSATTSAEKSMTGTSPTGAAASETTEPEAITELVSFTAPSGNVGTPPWVQVSHWRTASRSPKVT